MAIMFAVCPSRQFALWWLVFDEMVGGLLTYYPTYAGRAVAVLLLVEEARDAPGVHDAARRSTRSRPRLTGLYSRSDATADQSPPVRHPRGAKPPTCQSSSRPSSS